MDCEARTCSSRSGTKPKRRFQEVERMLKLSRKSGQGLVFTTESGERIELIVYGSGTIRTAIDAPDSVRVLRSELEEEPNEPCEIG